MTTRKIGRFDMERRVHFQSSWSSVGLLAIGQQRHRFEECVEGDVHHQAGARLHRKVLGHARQEGWSTDPDRVLAGDESRDGEESARIGKCAERSAAPNLADFDGWLPSGRRPWYCARSPTVSPDAGQPTPSPTTRSRRASIRAYGSYRLPLVTSCDAIPP